MSWLDLQDQDKVNASLAKLAAGNSRLREYSNGDPRFELWLALCDRRCARRIGLGIFDLADYLWYDAYEGDMSPADAVQDCLENDDMYAAFVAAETGDY